MSTTWIWSRRHHKVKTVNRHLRHFSDTVQKPISSHRQSTMTLHVSNHRMWGCMDRRDSVHIPDTGESEFLFFRATWLQKVKFKFFQLIDFFLYRTYTPEALSPEQQMQQSGVPRMGVGNLSSSSATPTMARMKAIGGVPTPIAVSSPVRRWVEPERILSPISLKWDTRKRVETLISLLKCVPRKLYAFHPSLYLAVNKIRLLLKFDNTLSFCNNIFLFHSAFFGDFSRRSKV